ncbi:MAG TPA: cytochrome c [Candidatus Tectomicrobia bacterium]
MSIDHRWIASGLVLLWVWGGVLGGVALGGAGDPGKEVYQKRCQSCHGPDGKGNPKMAETLKVTMQELDVTTPTVLGKPETELLKAIANGKGKMPPLGKVLNEPDQRAVLSYMKLLVMGAR